MTKHAEKLFFLDQSIESFDEQGVWAVSAIDLETVEITFQGLGKNQHLSFTTHYLMNEALFETHAKAYIQEKERIEAARRRALAAGQISKEEAAAPVLVLEHFPREFFFTDSRTRED